MKKTLWKLLSLCLLFATSARAVTLTEYDPDVHKAVFMMAVDDWVDDVYLDSAEAIGAPITWFIDPAENDGTGDEATRRALMLEAFALGHEIAAHTSTAVTSTTTVGQARAMFRASASWITQQTGKSPVSWTYYGNQWNAASQSVVREYFPGVIRLRDTSSDASPVSPYRDGATKPPDTFSGIMWINENAPYPLPMYRLDQMVYTSYLCTTCLSGAEDADTSGTKDFFDDLVAIRGVAITSVHPGGDISPTQLAYILRSGKAREDIWFCTAQQFAEEFGDALDEDNYGVIHAAPYGKYLGRGTVDDPAPITTALKTWGQTIQLKDTSYSIETLFGPATDMVISSNHMVRGPATIVCDASGVGTTASNLKLSLLPSTSNYTGYRGGISNLTVDLINADYASSSVDMGVQITRSQAVIDSCRFTGGASGECAQVYCSDANVDGVRLRFNAFDLDSAGTCAGIQRSSGAGMSGWLIANNTFRCTTSGNKYGIFAAVALAADDSLLNNRFINGSNSSTFYGLRLSVANSATAPYYTSLCNGSEFVGTPAKAWLKTTARTISSDGGACLDSLVDSSDAIWGDKMFWKADTTISDTTRFGGLALEWLGSASRWGSIGPTQHTATPFVSRDLPAARAATPYAQIESPWKLLALVNAGVLPASDSLDAATWYPIRVGTTVPEQEQYRLFIDAHGRWPYATRQKIHLKPE